VVTKPRDRQFAQFMITRCEECGSRFDRPGFFNCDKSNHPEPDLAQKIVAAIELDLNDRKGLGINSLDDDIQDEIRDMWTELVRTVQQQEYRQ